MEQLSRRSFVSGAAAAGAIITTALTSQASPAKAETVPAYLPEHWDYEADVVIVGYGGSGATAAREAIAQGSSCIVLEKCDREMAGGSTCACAGALFANNVDMMYDHCGGYISHETLEVIDAEANRVKNWLTANGLDQSYFGKSVYASIAAATDACGATVLYETPARKLVYDPATREVYGVLASDASGADVYVKANKGVLLATGGFLGNEELMHRFILSRRAHLANVGAPTCTGDGLLMAMEVGAALKNLTWLGLENNGQGGVAIKAASDELGTGMLHCPTGDYTGARIIVNQRGQRFMNEDHYYNHYKGNNAYFQFEGRWQDYKGYVNLPMYLIFDSQLFNSGTIGPRNYYLGWNMAKGLYEWSEDNKAELERGWIVQGNTIEELVENLAASTGNDPIDVDGLKKTLTAFNGYCTNGYDEDFQRGEEQYPECAARIQPIGEPPYYACELTPAAILTIGGLQWGEDGSTLNWDGEAIPGLYHAGDVGQPGEISPFGLRDCMGVASITSRTICQKPSREIPGDATVVIDIPTADQMAMADITGFDALEAEGPSAGEIEEAIANASGSYAAGTYTEGAQGRNDSITLTVSFSDTAITGIEVVSQNETEGVGDVAIGQMIDAVLLVQSADVDTVAGATISSTAVRDIVASCIEKASV